MNDRIIEITYKNNGEFLGRYAIEFAGIIGKKIAFNESILIKNLKTTVKTVSIDQIDELEQRFKDYTNENSDNPCIFCEYLLKEGLKDFIASRIFWFNDVCDCADFSTPQDIFTYNGSERNLKLELNNYDVRVTETVSILTSDGNTSDYENVKLYPLNRVIEIINLMSAQKSSEELLTLLKQLKEYKNNIDNTAINYFNTLTFFKNL